MKTPPEVMAYLEKMHKKKPLYLQAKDIGVSSSGLYGMKDGYQMPHPETLQKIINFVGVPLTITIIPEKRRVP